jgi:hypothetical protein
MPHAPDRKAERRIAHLAGFVGVQQVDGYGRVPPQRNAATFAFCWGMHAAASFELAAGPAPIASEALQRIACLYHIVGRALPLHR